MQKSTEQSAFTLLEVMAALMIFSIIAVGSLGIIGTLTRSRLALQRQSEALTTLQTLVMTTQHDISQITPRETSYSQQPSTSLNPYLLMAANEPFTFPLLNWPNPLGRARSTLACVRYRLTDGYIERELAPYSQHTPFLATLSDEIASGISQVNYFPVQSVGPTLQPGQHLPIAIEVSATLLPYGTVYWLTPLVQSP